MSIVEHIKPENILLDLKPESKRDLFNKLAATFKETGQLDDKGIGELVEKLEEREKISTTGIGEGIAIPHASADKLNETAISVGVVPGGVAYGSVDGKPVKLVFMILGSQAVPRLHIQILARIVRLCKNKELMKKIEDGSSPKEVLDAIRMVDN